MVCQRQAQIMRQTQTNGELRCNHELIVTLTDKQKSRLKKKLSDIEISIDVFGDESDREGNSHATDASSGPIRKTTRTLGKY